VMLRGDATRSDVPLGCEPAAADDYRLVSTVVLDLYQRHAPSITTTSPLTLEDVRRRPTRPHLEYHLIDLFGKRRRALRDLADRSATVSATATVDGSFARYE
jgi:hypothetical protein